MSRSSENNNGPSVSGLLYLLSRPAKTFFSFLLIFACIVGLLIYLEIFSVNKISACLNESEHINTRQEQSQLQLQTPAQGQGQGSTASYSGSGSLVANSTEESSFIFNKRRIKGKAKGFSSPIQVQKESKCKGAISNGFINIVMFCIGGGNEVIKLKVITNSILLSRSAPIHFHLSISLSERAHLVEWSSGLNNSCTRFSFYDGAEHIKAVENFMKLARFRTDHYSGAFTTMKMITHELFPDLPNAIILDSDMVVTRDINDLFREYDVTKQVGLVCHLDPSNHPAFCLPETCDQTSHTYCLGGVFVMNLELMRQNSFTAMVIKELNRVADKYPDYISKVADQDIWNIIYGQHHFDSDYLYPLPCGWNCVYNQQSHNRKDMWPSCRNTRCGILHYNCAAWTHDANDPRRWLTGMWKGYEEMPLPMMQVDCDREIVPMSLPFCPLDD